MQILAKEGYFAITIFGIFWQNPSILHINLSVQVEAGAGLSTDRPLPVKTGI